MGPAIIPFCVSTIEDAQKMRVIRNEVRQFMTRNTTEISSYTQEDWWNFRRDEVFCFIYYDRKDSKLTDPMGYGLVRRERGFPLLTGALREWARGKGYGRAIFEHLIRVAGVPCHVEVREDNPSARTLYEHLGFEVVVNERNDGVLSMTLTVENALKAGVI